MGLLGFGAAVKGATNMGFASHAIGIGMNIGFQKMSGDSTGEAVVKGALWYGAEKLVPGAMMLPMLVDAGKAGYEMYMDNKLYGQGKIQQYYHAGFGGNFNDTQQAYTMRQRGVQALQQSKMNARSVLGSEARTYHR